ncbi:MULTISPECIES: hypothetical protein [Bacillaceae]|uniref:DUF4367 domain-containing protein n=1 Tax=Evansella alkalicola TaxID=745819 RepID=A0ABS6JYU9_9BACI|nr:MULTISPECIES: hypothetical protein [Bacillaceae]MBU9723769.1 hypothetical protein [Bacillus alkalicola]
MNRFSLFSRIKLTILFLIIVSFTFACQSEGAVEPDEVVAEYIHTDFSYSPFQYPEDWELVAVSSDVQLLYQDWDEPEKHRYADVPYRYGFTFGEKAEENVVTEEELETFNEDKALMGETTRQHYYHTYYQHYGNLHLSKNGFIRLVSQHETGEEWVINGEEFRVLRDGNEWVVNWFKNGTYYDLIVLGEAGISDEENFEELLEFMFLQGL